MFARRCFGFWVAGGVVAVLAVSCAGSIEAVVDDEPVTEADGAQTTSAVAPVTVLPDPQDAAEPSAAAEPSVAEPPPSPSAVPTPTPAVPTTEALVYELAGEMHLDSIATLAGVEPGFPLVAFGGFERVEIFERPGYPSVVSYPGRALGLETAERSFLASMVGFDGRLIASIGDDPQAPDLIPRLVEWRRGAPVESLWFEITTTVTKQAGSARATTAFTPPSPPFAGASGILDFAVHGRRLHATGWATVEGTVRNVMWTSVDGRDWSLEVLPAIGEGTEYGSQLVVNDSGVVVNVGNWTYFGAGVIARPSGGDWRTLGFPETQDANGWAQLVDSVDGFWVHDVRFDEPDIVHGSSDLAIWDRWELPEGAEPEGAGDSFWHVAVEGSVPMAYSAADGPGPEATTGVHRWNPTTREWLSARIPGNYVDTIDGYVVTKLVGTVNLTAS